MAHRGRRLGALQRTPPHGLTPASPPAAFYAEVHCQWTFPWVWVGLPIGEKELSLLWGGRTVPSPHSLTGGGSTTICVEPSGCQRALPTWGDSQEGPDCSPAQGSRTHQQPDTKAQNLVALPQDRYTERDRPAGQHPCPNQPALLEAGGWEVGEGLVQTSLHCLLIPARPGQYSPPPARGMHDKSMNQPPHARLRGAIFSTSSELTISFFSKKKIVCFSSSLFVPLSLLL